MDSWPRIVVHADMDAFYAAVEQLDDPCLQDKAVLVGPRSRRGVVLTASYEARPFGVGSAMPMAEALRRCPDAVVVPPRFERYEAISKQVMDVFADFAPAVEPLSLDEAFLEMTGSQHIFGPPEVMGRKIKDAVREATNLNISVGISATKYVAKVASGHDKPNGLTVVAPEAVAGWLAPLPVNRLWGVGVKTTPKLHALGLKTIGDIAAADKSDLYANLGNAGLHYHNLAKGIDTRSVSRGRRAKSVGSDRTLTHDVSAREDIELHLRRAAERIARRLRAKKYVARGVRVRLKTNKFEMLSRQTRLRRPDNTAESLFATARKLIARFDHPGPFRLVGMEAFDLDWCTESGQSDLFEDHRNRDLETTIDQIVERFGKQAMVRANDLGDRGTVADNGTNLDFLDLRGQRAAKPR